ncbi:hypothetical protein CASFOL_030747 [Castilleja foliolosa]|uniref:Uncharacterized protein n=1 Tax=Castilleja foliolosa TaxID=1961234 RepID=A0ABD3C700_9LAMI
MRRRNGCVFYFLLTHKASGEGDGEGWFTEETITATGGAGFWGFRALILVVAGGCGFGTARRFTAEQGLHFGFSPPPRHSSAVHGQILPGSKNCHRPPPTKPGLPPPRLGATISAFPSPPDSTVTGKLQSLAHTPQTRVSANSPTVIQPPEPRRCTARSALSV